MGYLTYGLLTQSEVVMEGTTLLALPEGMQIKQIQVCEKGLVIEVTTTTATIEDIRLHKISL